MYLKLGKKQIASSCKEYVLGGIIGRNIGYAEIKIYCRGSIRLTFNEDTLIDVTDFCLNPEKYRLH